MLHEQFNDNHILLKSTVTYLGPDAHQLILEQRSVLNFIEFLARQSRLIPYALLVQEGD